jgi:isoleucyl-tRNA synthetase
MTDTKTEARDWGKTLFLPKTNFPMKAGLPQLEPRMLERWAEDPPVSSKPPRERKGRPKFVLHDGPPYANGNIHIGTRSTRSSRTSSQELQQMLGLRLQLCAGLGLPRPSRSNGRSRSSTAPRGRRKPNFSDPAAMNAFRDECRAFAEQVGGRPARGVQAARRRGRLGPPLH